MTLAVLLALLLHALALLAFYLSPSDTPPAPRQTIDITLESPPPDSPPLLERRPPPPTPQPKLETPPPVTPPLKQPDPAAPAAEPAPQAVQAATSAASAETPVSSTPPAEEIQPLFRLTRMPGFSKKVEAAYPPAERRAGAQANVLAEVTIDSVGSVISVRILKSGGAAFDDAVKQALMKSTFTPGMIDNKPVGTRFQVPFRFNLN